MCGKGGIRAAAGRFAWDFAKSTWFEGIYGTARREYGYLRRKLRPRRTCKPRRICEVPVRWDERWKEGWASVGRRATTYASARDAGTARTGRLTTDRSVCAPWLAADDIDQIQISKTYSEQTRRPDRSQARRGRRRRGTGCPCRWWGQTASQLPPARPRAVTNPCAGSRRSGKGMESSCGCHEMEAWRAGCIRWMNERRDDLETAVMMVHAKMSNVLFNWTAVGCCCLPVAAGMGPAKRLGNGKGQQLGPTPARSALQKPGQRCPTSLRVHGPRPIHAHPSTSIPYLNSTTFDLSNPRSIHQRVHPRPPQHFEPRHARPPPVTGSPSFIKMKDESKPTPIPPPTRPCFATHPTDMATPQTGSARRRPSPRLLRHLSASSRTPPPNRKSRLLRSPRSPSRKR